MENGVCCAAARSAAVKRAAMAPGPKNDFMMSTPEVEVDFQSAYRSMRIREKRPDSEREVGEKVNQDKLRWLRADAFP